MASKLDLFDLRTLYDIAVRFKGSTDLQGLFNIYLLTLMGRLRLSRAAVYVSGQPADRYRRFLSKGKGLAGAIPEWIELPVGSIQRGWVRLDADLRLDGSGTFARLGFSIAWNIGESRRPDKTGALLFVGSDAHIVLSRADGEFVESLNKQMIEIIDRLDSFSQADDAGDFDWNRTLESRLRARMADQPAFPRENLIGRVIFRPSAKIGGDFYEIFPFEDGQLGVALVDIVGHGIPAALWTQAVREHLRREVREDLAPADLLEKLNAAFLSDQKGEFPVSMCYALFDPAQNTVTYSSAGMDYPLLYRRRPGKWFDLPAGGLFLGCLPDQRFSQETLYWNEGDLILLYTDGLQQAISGGWKEKSREFLDHPDLNSRELADRLNQSLLQTADSVSPMEDDLTAILLTPTGSNPDSAFVYRSRLQLPSDVRHLPALRTFVNNLLQSRPNMASKDSFAIRFTTEDAVLNAIQHGYRGSTEGRVEIESIVQSDEVIIEVVDKGCGFQFRPDTVPGFFSESECYRSNGRGLYMMFQLMDRVEMDARPGSGTRVRMTKQLGPSTARPRGI